MLIIVSSCLSVYIRNKQYASDSLFIGIRKSWKINYKLDVLDGNSEIGAHVLGGKPIFLHACATCSELPS